jgi:hypothetical protein
MSGRIDEPPEFRLQPSQDAVPASQSWFDQTLVVGEKSDQIVTISLKSASGMNRCLEANAADRRRTS